MWCTSGNGGKIARAARSLSHIFISAELRSKKVNSSVFCTQMDLSLHGF